MRAHRTLPVLVLMLVSWPIVRAEEPIKPGVHAVTFSPDGRLLAAGTGLREEPGQLTLWDLATRKPRWTHREDKGVYSVAFAPDGRTLALASFERAARLLDTATGEVRATFGDHAKDVRSVAFAPDGRTLATASYDKTIKLWDVASRTERSTLECHADMIYWAAFSPDGKLLISAGRDGVKLWDTATGQEKYTWKHGGTVARCAIFSPDSRWAITGGWDGTVQLRNVQTGQLRARLQNVGGGVEMVAFSPASRTLAVCGVGKSIHLFEVTLAEPTENEREQIRALLVKMDDDAYATREAAGRELREIGFVAEPELRRASQEAKSVEVRIRARRLRMEMLSQARAILTGPGSQECIAFSPDGKLLASGGKDATIRLWDVTAKKELACLP